MGWHPPVPAEVQDPQGTRWTVVRAWPDSTAGDYVLELRTEARPGVRAARFRSGRLEPIRPDGDRHLPALTEAARRGEVVVHRAHKRAVVRGTEGYLKVFRPGRAADAAARHAHMGSILAAGEFRAPGILARIPDGFVLAPLAGRSFFELGQDPALSHPGFERIWRHWSRGWVRQHLRAAAPGARTGAHLGAHTEAYVEAQVAALPGRPAAAQVESMQRMVDRWLQHARDVPAARDQREAVQAAARDITRRLLGGSADPLVWSHGDLHDKQIFADVSGGPLGLLDFDEAGRAEAAVDLANLAVHLDLRLRQQRLTVPRYRAARGLVFAAARELAVTPDRFDAYADATRLRLTCLYAFRPQWAALAEDFLTVPDATEKAPGDAVGDAGEEAAAVTRG